MNRKILAGLMTGMLVLQMSVAGVWGAEAADEEQIEEESEKVGTGTVNGLTYEQDYFGFAVELEDGWMLADEEQLQQLGNSLTDMATDEIRDAIDSGNSYLDMYGENSETFQNINATITKISLPEAILFTTDPATVVGEMIDPIKDQIEQMGFSNVEIKQDEIEFMGDMVPSVRIVSYPEELGGEIPLYQTQVYFQKGTYLLSLTATAYVDDTTLDILSYCTKR